MRLLTLAFLLAATPALAGPVKVRNNPYRTDTGQTLDAVPPKPYQTMGPQEGY